MGIGLIVGAITIGAASPPLINGLGGFSGWKEVLFLPAIFAICGGVFAYIFIREGPFRGLSPPFHRE